MRQRELLEFRTPQHPSSGTNNWGGASPLLARDVPKESLEQKYLKLNTIRTRDEMFIAEEDEFIFSPPPTVVEARDPKTARRRATTHRRRRRGVLLRFIWPEKEKTTNAAKKKRWLPEFDHRRRWPQGWC